MDRTAPVVKRATIITDASVNETLRIGGWAAWIKVDGLEAALCSGAFKVEVRSSYEGEAMAIANAIAAAAINDMLDGIQIVMVQSDALAVLQAFAANIKNVIVREPLEGGSQIRTGVKRRAQRIKNRNPLVTETMKRIRNLRAHYGFKLELRHVKGHATGKEFAAGAHRVNHLCDKAAKTARKLEEKRRAAAPGPAINYAASLIDGAQPDRPFYSFEPAQEIDAL